MKLQKFYIIILLLFLSACAGQVTPNIDVARKASYPKDMFLETLRGGYINMADEQWQQGDKDDAMRFGQKAMAITHGITPEMDTLYNRKISLTHLNELLGSRYFLESAFVKGVKEEIPGEAAMAQLMFDCWLDETEESVQSERPCKDDFHKFKQEIDAVLTDIKMMDEAKRQRMIDQHKRELARKLAAQKASLRKMPEDSFIFFQFNSIALGVTGKALLDKVAKDIEAFKPRKVVIAGNTDLVGNAKTNMKLAMQRGRVVANYLIKNHKIDPNLLDVKAYGENNPRRKNRRKDINNRYVQITFMKDNRVYY
jgi:OOP family OmpA-OmpF porin